MSVALGMVRWASRTLGVLSSAEIPADLTVGCMQVISLQLFAKRFSLYLESRSSFAAGKRNVSSLGKLPL